MVEKNEKKKLQKITKQEIDERRTKWKLKTKNKINDIKISLIELNRMEITV